MLPSAPPSHPLTPLSCIPLYPQLSSRFTFFYPASKAPKAVVLSLFATFSLSRPLYPLTLLLLTLPFLPSPFLQTPPPPLSPAAMVSSASCSSTFLTSSPLLFNPPLHTLPFNKYTPTSLPHPPTLSPRNYSHLNDNNAPAALSLPSFNPFSGSLPPLIFSQLLFFLRNTQRRDASKNTRTRI